MGLKRLIIMLSMILVISPVSSAYASPADNVSNSTDKSTSHCKHGGKEQAPAQDMKSCCDNDQCGPSCRTMHCSQSAVSIGILVAAHGVFQPQPALAMLSVVKDDPGGGWTRTLLRPPKNTF
jgi:hypothetical protein